MIELPQSFIQSVSCCKGFDEESFREAHQKPAPTSIRLNPFKPTELSFALNQPVPWSGNGFYLAERPNFTYDVLFQAGCYYVQEAGSMFIEQALKQCVDFNQPLVALDLCASPGGKSTLINSLLNAESVLVANEVVKQRAEVLCQNLSKWGTSNVIVTNNDPSSFSEMRNTFDVMLIDAPCSGSGLFRKQADAVDEWSLDNVNLCSARQKRILAEVIGSLKNQGILIYSTCSYSEQENEEIVDWLLTEFDLETIQLTIDNNWGIVETESKINKGFGYRFYPNRTQSEGFFCSALKKKTSTGSATNIEHFRKQKHDAFTEIKPAEKTVFNNWINTKSEQAVIKFKDDYLLTNALAIDFINKNKQLYLKKVGTNLGMVIKNDLLPHHDLAWSVAVLSTVQTINCSNEEALLYLKKELHHINGNKGWNLMCFENLGIGWIKHLGNRFNNYFPSEYRILR